MDTVVPRRHPSSSPEVAAALLEASLENGQVPPQLHYVTEEQSARWLELHQAWSPSRNDAACDEMYGEAFLAADRCLEQDTHVRVVGVGCGGGRKDRRLVACCRDGGRKVSYTAADLSPALVREALACVGGLLPPEDMEGWVVDFSGAPDWRPGRSGTTGRGRVSVFSVIGMLPNTDPHRLLSHLHGWSEPGDVLVLGVNLAPGEDAAAGCRAVLPRYDNDATRRWLELLLGGWGVGREDWEMEFRPAVRRGIHRIEVRARFKRGILLAPPGAGSHAFGPERPLQLFYSNRPTRVQMEELLEQSGWRPVERRVLDPGEEGVWVCRRAGGVNRT